MRPVMFIPLVLVAGCQFFECGTEAPAPYELSTFKVEATGVFFPGGDGGTPLDVVADCVQGFPSQADVPLELRGTRNCPYIIPSGEVRIRLHATALDKDNKKITHPLNPVAFRVIPGDLSNDQYARWGTLTEGEISTEVRVIHPYSEVRVWVEDAPPKKVYTLGAEPDLCHAFDCRVRAGSAGPPHASGKRGRCAGGVPAAPDADTGRRKPDAAGGLNR